MIYIISAIDENMLIGSNNKLPWHNKEDLKFFKETTIDSTVIMGRKTYESFGIAKPLPNRVNVVITRDEEYDPQHPDVIVVHSLDEALSTLTTANTFVIGGAAIYQQALLHPMINFMYLTHIPGKYNGDTYFPAIPAEWKEVKRIPAETCEFVLYAKPQNYNN